MIQLKQLIDPNNIFEILLTSIAITLPFGMLFNSIAIICSLFFSIIIVFKSGIRNLRFNVVTKLFFGLFTVMNLSILYSTNIDYALTVFSRSTLFLIIPIVVTIAKPYLRPTFLHKLLKRFIFGCLIASIICLLVALYNTYQYGAFNPFNSENGNFFSYFNLTAILKMHPIYFGSSIIFSLSIVAYSLLSYELSRIQIAKRIIVIVFFITILLLLNSFMLIITLVLILGIILYKIVKSSFFNIKKASLYIFIFVIPFYFTSTFIVEKSKGVHIKEDIRGRDFSGKDFTALKARVAKAYCSIDLIQDNFLFGVGIGDGNDELLEYYLKNGFKFGYDEKYNSHNQFLTTFIYTGVVGFFLLLTIVVYLLKQAITTQNYYLLFFIILHICFFMTESVLERQSGIVFFVFFSAVLTLDQKSTVTLLKD